MAKAKKTETPETPETPMNPETPGHACLTDAWREARAEMPAPKFDAVNPHYRSRYASLAELLRVAVPTLAKHKIGLTQRTAYEDGVTIVVTEMLFWGDKNGEERFVAEYPAIAKDSTNPQALGSAITYARRYSLAALLAIAAEDDDDGNAATSGTSGNGNRRTATAASVSARIEKPSKAFPPPSPSSEEVEKWTLIAAKAKLQEAKALPHLRNIAKKHGSAWNASLGEEELAILRAYHKGIEREMQDTQLGPFEEQVDPLNGQ